MNDGFYRGDLSSFELRSYIPDYSEGFRDRKDERTAFYLTHIHKNKLIECTACSGYKYYCGGACGCCSGTGKTRQR